MAAPKNSSPKLPTQPGGKRIAIYCRVSTLNGQSVEMQLCDLRRLAEHRGFEIIREYLDEGVSGAVASRPSLDEMLTDARRGNFQAILVWKLDRLGRSLTHLVRLLDDFRAWGIELISFSEGLDFSTATGKLLYQVICAFAEFGSECAPASGMRRRRGESSDGRGLPWTLPG